MAATNEFRVDHHLIRLVAGALVMGMVFFPWSWAMSQTRKGDPPKAAVKFSGDRQIGNLQSFCWTVPGTEIGEYYSTCETKRIQFPLPHLGIGRSGTPAFYLRRAIPPAEYSFTYWTKLRRDGSPRGEGRVLRTTLLPSFQGGRVGYSANLDLPKTSGHYFLRFFASWSDEDGSLTNESANWTFHMARGQGGSS